ncbi:MAG: HD domain-containing protein [Gemmatimonadetes bacterium]|nr:HD domain-containing protein [Gemmatimonadota bacterium]
MSTQSEFLNAFVQSLSASALYPEGHVSRARALDLVYDKAKRLLEEDAFPYFSFIGGEVVYGNIPLREMRHWEWSQKLADIGVQRLEFDETLTQPELGGVLDEIGGQFAHQSVSSAEARQMQRRSMKYGEIGMKGEELDSEIGTATLSFNLKEESEAIKWMHEEIQVGQELPLVEAEAVVRSLSVAMHGDQQVMIPLLKIKEYDEYTVTHCLNVSVLAMALAEWIGLGGRDVRAFGVAGLLHDLGKTKIPKDILHKPGKLEENEREVMNRHPAEGSRIILESHDNLDLAAVVAYEHHIMIDGGGYPQFKYARDCHQGSKLVHVCDVYDALRTNRPYRDAWPSEKVLNYLDERAGTEFDNEIATKFVRMMKLWEPHIARVSADEAVPSA